MKRLLLIVPAVVIAAMCGVYLIAADHIDAPAVGTLAEGTTVEDIADYYAFDGENDDNYVFVATVLSLTAPSASGAASFDKDVMYEINIDNDGDFLEDLVIQAIFRDGNVIVFGPTAPGSTGLNSQIENGGMRVEAQVTPYGDNPIIGESNGVRIFAGTREDPFFLDFFRFRDVVNGAGDNAGLEVEDPRFGMEYATSFRDAENAEDTFAGTNVLALVVELPKTMLGGPTINTWLESKRRN
ncbi:MAG: DUF4331 family protein [Bacteroidota bacterium]